MAISNYRTTPLLFCLALLICLSSCAGKPVTKLEDVPLPEFIQGQWQAEIKTQDIHGEYVEKYLIEFRRDNTLEFKVLSPYSDVNDKFKYEFLDDTTILVENDRVKGGEWKIDQDGDKILVDIWSNSTSLEFTRVAK